MAIIWQKKLRIFYLFFSRFVLFQKIMHMLKCFLVAREHLITEHVQDQLDRSPTLAPAILYHPMDFFSDLPHDGLSVLSPRRSTFWISGFPLFELILYRRIGPVAELCRSFNRILCAKGE
jgi:hypothetical protein